MKPVKTFGDYVVCFEAQAEDISMRQHFIKECKWTEKEYREIKGFAWFCAKVTLHKDGKELAGEYLGACCYETEEEFWTTYAGCYFADMVRTCAEEVGDEELIKQVAAWAAGLNEGPRLQFAEKEAPDELA